MEINTDQLKALSEVTRGELYDSEWDGGQWMHRAVETQDTLENFINASENWTESAGFERGEIAGLPFVAWKNVQARKGDTRTAMSVIDFGTCRVAVDVFAPNYI